MMSMQQAQGAPRHLCACSPPRANVQSGVLPGGLQGCVGKWLAGPTCEGVCCRAAYSAPYVIWQRRVTCCNQHTRQRQADHGLFPYVAIWACLLHTSTAVQSALCVLKWGAHAAAYWFLSYIILCFYIILHSIYIERERESVE
jgi:hypothetical protein